MATTKAKIERWFKEGVKMGATHMIVACDTFDWSDYPVYVKSSENARERAEEYGRNNSRGFPTLKNSNMQKVVEVYSLSMSMEDQLRERRAFHFD